MSRMNPAIPPTTSVLCTILNGATGVLASAVAYMATIVQDVEVYLRITALFGGLIVTLLTIIKLWRDIKKK